MSESTTALAIFDAMEVAAPLQSKILEFDPEFAKRSEADQRTVITFMLTQAAKTTEGVRSRFPVISIKHGGAEVFEMPKGIGDEKSQKVEDFEGEILDQYPTKAYWENEGEANGSQPDCASLNAVDPYVDNPVTAVDAGGCLACPFNKFGSATKGNGKRCRDVKRVILHVDGHELPVRLQVSASNLKPFDNYLRGLRDLGYGIGSVRTKFMAVEARNKSGTAFTGIELSTVRKLELDEIIALQRDMIEPFQADFRFGELEADTDAPESAGDTPSEESVAAAADAGKASDVM